MIKNLMINASKVAPTPPVSQQLWTWGQGAAGEHGLNLTGNQVISSPVQVGALTNWASISTNQFSVYAIKTDGTLWAWGTGSSGQVPVGANNSYSSPKQVGALTNWLKVSGGSYISAYAIKTDGTLWAWGANSDGALGDGTITNRNSPVQIGSLTNWSVVSGANNCGAAIKTDGTLWTWGNNGNGQLGSGTTTNRSSPVQVGALTNWLSIAGFYFNFSSVKTDGTLWVMGNGTYGQLGLSDTADRSSPTQLGALTGWAKPCKGTNGTIIFLAQSNRNFQQGVKQ